MKDHNLENFTPKSKIRLRVQLFFYNIPLSILKTLQYNTAINTTSLSLPSTSTTAKSTSNKLEGRRKILKLSWRLILILIVAFSFGEVVKYCKRLATNCISSHLNCSVPFIFLAPNTACHCRHKHLLREASC